jgi:hypothetical protein
MPHKQTVRKLMVRKFDGGTNGFVVVARDLTEVERTR